MSNAETWVRLWQAQAASVPPNAKRKERRALAKAARRMLKKVKREQTRRS